MQAGRGEFAVRYVWSAYGGAATSPAPASSASSASRAGLPLPGAPGSHHSRNGATPAGLLIAAPNAAILYQTLAKAPLLGDAERALSTRHFLRELNRFGVTSAIDPSGGFQSLAILSADYFTVPDGKIADIEPLCMVAGGRGGLRRGGSSKGWTSRSRTLRRAGALSPGTAASAQAHGPGWPWLASWPSWPLPRLISGQIDR